MGHRHPPAPADRDARGRSHLPGDHGPPQGGDPTARPLASDGDRDLAALEEGLDVLELARADRTSPLYRLAAWLLPKLAAIAVLVAAWEAAVLLHLEPDYILPSPLDVIRSQPVIETWRQGGLLQLPGGLQVYLGNGYALGIASSLLHALFGYLASLLVGTISGVAIARLRLLRVGVGSLIGALQTMPSVAWVPIGLLVFGNSVTTIYFVVILGAFPSIAGGTMAALDHVPPLLSKVGRSMGARGFALYRHVIFPAAMPGYVAGLKQAWAFSWRSLMAAELIGGTHLGVGLGQLLHTGQDTSDMTLAIAAMLVILVVGLVIEELIFARLDVVIRTRRGLAAAHR